MSIAGVTDARRFGEPKDIKILTPGGQSIVAHSEWKMAREYEWVKKLGLKVVFSFIAAVATVTVLIVQLATPAVKQGEINGATTKALDNLTTTQKDAEDRQSKALLEGLNEIKVLVKQTNDLSISNRDEVRATRESTERQLIEVRQDTKGLWNWLGELKLQQGEMKGRLTVLESQRPKEK